MISEGLDLDEVADRLLTLLRSRASARGHLRNRCVPLAEVRDELSLPLVRDAATAFDRLYARGQLRMKPGGWLQVTP